MQPSEQPKYATIKATGEKMIVLQQIFDKTIQKVVMLKGSLIETDKPVLVDVDSVEAYTLY